MLTIRNLQKTYRTNDQGRPAVAGLSIQLEKGEFYTLLGPSGCGKTTTLRSVAGLEKPDAGEIKIGDFVVFSSARGIAIPTHKRRIGMVFQSYAIWPHMTVFDNLAFPLIAQGNLSRRTIKDKVSQALALVQLEDYAERPAPFLSGGQQQRVALARALVYEPEVLLLDEPLSNLDAKLRSEMRFELKRLTQRLNLTTLYVTHDQLEALSLSDRVAVMNQGRILQEDNPQAVYWKPADPFVANFIGSGMNMLKAEVLGTANGCVQLKSPWGVFECADPHARVSQGDEVLIGIRPEGFEVYLDPPGNGCSSNVVRARLELATFTGDGLEFQAVAGSQLIRGRTGPWTSLKTGQDIFLHCPPERCVLLSSSS